MEVKEEKRGKLLILSPVGRLDGNTSDSFKDQLKKAIHQGESQILMDFSQTEYISSMGLRVIISVAQELKKSDEKMVFVCPPSPILSVFKSAGFVMLFPFYQSLEEAEQGLRL